MIAAHAEKRIRERREIAREQQRRDPRPVGLERQRDDVAHQPRALGKILRRLVSQTVDAHLDAAHARQVVVEPVSVRRARRPAETRGGIAHEVQQAVAGAARATLEQTIERARRMHLLRGGRIGAPPRDVRAVGQREAGLVRPANRRLARKHKAGARRRLSDALREHLIDGHARSHDRARAERCAGQKIAGLRGMDARPDGRLVEQAVDHVDLVLQRLERLERSAQLHHAAAPARPPVVAVDAVAHDQHGEPLRKLARPVEARRVERQRLEPRQGERGARGTEDDAPGDPVHRVTFGSAAGTPCTPATARRPGRPTASAVRAPRRCARRGSCWNSDCRRQDTRPRDRSRNDAA